MTRVVAVTGAGGRVGAACLRAQADRGEVVIAVDRRRGNGPGEWRRADLRRARSARRALAGATHLIHLAGYPAPDPSLGWRVLTDNVAMTANVLDAFAGGRPETAVLASSFCVYGLVFPPSLGSPQYLPIDEDHPAKAADPYGLSKIALEHLAGVWSEHTGATSVAIRFPWTAAPGESERISRYLGSMRDDPHSSSSAGSLWTSVHIDDLADAFVRALDVHDGRAHVLNVSSPWLPVDEALTRLAASAHPRAERRPGLDDVGALDTRRARELLGWAPTRTFADVLPSPR